MKPILIIADNYPSQENPTRGVFVYNLIQQFTKFYQVDIVSPTAYNLMPNERALQSDKSNVVFPKFLSFSKISKRKGIINRFVQKLKKRAVVNAIKPSVDYQFVYCHFLSSAIPIMEFCKKRNIPLYVAMGESSIEIRYQAILHNKDYLEHIGKHLSGVIAVSEKLHNFCCSELKISTEKILISPNATDTQSFKPFHVDRSFLNIDKDDIVISFTGAFIKRKGIDVLLKAVNELDKVKLILIGSGEVDVPIEKIAFKGRLPHLEIPKYLNASDVFIFPTKAEGSSNAIAEAMACGLPIITSNIPEVVFQIGKGNAIFIDPNDDVELKRAIQKLIEDKNLRKQLSEKSLQIAKDRTIENRAKQILKWIENNG